MRRLALVVLLLAATTATAWAHKPSDAQLHLTARGDQLVGRIDVSIRDLDAALGIDTDGNGEITWAEVRAAEPKIASYLAARLTIRADDQPCALHTGPAALVELIGGAYSAVPLDFTCAEAPHAIAVTYGLLFDLDAQHRGIIHVDDQLAIARDTTPVMLTLGPQLSRAPPVVAALRGIATAGWQLAIVLCIIAPIAIRRRRAPALRTTAVIEQVAAFTLGQLITLALIAAGVVQLPAAVVDVAIAISVVAVAINAVTRVVELRASIALELGLLHGFGLGELFARLGRPTALGVRALIGFSLGAMIAYAIVAGALLIAARAISARRGSLR